VLHLPPHLAHLPTYDVLQQKLRHLFNMLDRHFLGTAFNRFRLRIPRFVAIERTDGAGWHAHIAIKLWSDADGYVIVEQDFKAKLTEIWTYLAYKRLNADASFAVYVEKRYADYVLYSAKMTDWASMQGEVDLMNTVIDALRIA
jgi:hypothetical protein